MNILLKRTGIGSVHRHTCNLSVMYRQAMRHTDVQRRKTTNAAASYMKAEFV
jgi:hypothetical protein